MQRPKEFCFTLWYPVNCAYDIANSDSISRIERIRTTPPVGLAYITWQLELGGESQRYHLQGYCEWTRPLLIRSLQSRLDMPNTRFDRRHGTQLEAIAYTRKPDTRVSEFVEFGVKRVGQGARSDIAKMVEVLKASGGDVYTTGVTFPSVYVKFHRGIKELARLYQRGRPYCKPSVFVHWGVPGTGKTRDASTSDSPENVYLWRRSQNGNNYAMDYSGQRVCIFDDFYGGAWGMPFSLFLSLLDGIPGPVNTLGATHLFISKTIFLTSNVHPRHWYHWGRNIQWNALRRRIDKIIFYTPLGETYQPYVDVVQQYGANGLNDETRFRESILDSNPPDPSAIAPLSLALPGSPPPTLPLPFVGSSHALPGFDPV